MNRALLELATSRFAGRPWHGLLATAPEAKPLLEQLGLVSWAAPAELVTDWFVPQAVSRATLLREGATTHVARRRSWRRRSGGRQWLFAQPDWALEQYQVVTEELLWRTAPEPSSREWLRGLLTRPDLAAVRHPFTERERVILTQLLGSSVVRF